MTLHAPVQQAGAVHHHWLRDILIVGIVALLTIGAVWALSGIQPFSSTVSTTEAQSLIEYRAAERDSWVSTATSEEDSLIQFRADEHALP